MQQPSTVIKHKSPWQLGTATLLIANLATIAFFIAGHGSIMQVLWTYWLQSVIIGVIAVVRILTMPMQLQITTGSILPFGNATAGKAYRTLMAGFFMFHYGMFHLVYAVFLFSFSQPNSTIDINGTEQHLSFGGHINLYSVLFAGGLFAVHHTMTFISERRNQTGDGIKAIAVAFIKPYARILPMHLIIIFGPVIALFAGTSAVFVVFMALKTVADLKLQLSGTSHLQPSYVPVVVNPSAN